MLDKITVVVLFTAWLPHALAQSVDTTCASRDEKAARTAKIDSAPRTTVACHAGPGYLIAGT